MGHLVNKDGIAPLEDKVKAVKYFPLPTSKQTLREFLRLFNFYNLFISKFAHKLQPLNALLSDNNKELTWTTEAMQAFCLIKHILAEATLLSHPKPDAPLCIMTDASNVAIGPVLQQQVNNVWQPLS